MALVKPPEIARTGDDTPVRGLFHFVIRMSGWHQLGVVLLALAIAALNVAPLELQRRIVDDAIVARDIDLALWLGAVYLAAILAMGALKFCLRMYESWLSEGAILYCRRHLAGLWRDRHDDQDDAEEGSAVSIIRAEIEQVGGFVGEGLSEPAAHAGILVAILGYMLWVEPAIALLSFVFLAPQIVLTPLVQRRLNALTEQRLEMLRAVSGAVLGDDVDDGFDRLSKRVFDNQMLFLVWKFAAKTLLNLMNSLAPLAALVFGGIMVIQGETELGVVVAFVSGFQRLSEPIRQLIAYYRLAAQTAVKHDLIAKWM